MEKKNKEDIESYERELDQCHEKKNRVNPDLNILEIEGEHNSNDNDNCFKDVNEIMARRQK